MSNVKETLKLILKAASDKKAEDIVVIDLNDKTTYADYFVVLSGQSDRQVIAIVDSIIEVLKPHKIRPLGVEGHEIGLWALVDFGEIVVHCFQPQVRAYYDLEGFWADAERINPETLERISEGKKEEPKETEAGEETQKARPIRKRSVSTRKAKTEGEEAKPKRAASKSRLKG